MVLHKLLLWLKVRNTGKLLRCSERARQLSLAFDCVNKYYLLLVVLPFFAASVAALAQPSTSILNRIFQPFEDIIALVVAMIFGTGILGFIVMLADALLSWITGGSFGRSLAVSKLIRAIETLAVFPLAFFIIHVLKELGISEVAAVAEIADTLLSRGWQLIVDTLRGVR